MIIINNYIYIFNIMVTLMICRISQKEPLPSQLNNYLLPYTILSLNVPLSNKSKRELTRPPKLSTEASLNSLSLLLMLILSKLCSISLFFANRKYLLSEVERAICVCGIKKGSWNCLRNNKKCDNCVNPEEQAIQCK